MTLFTIGDAGRRSLTALVLMLPMATLAQSDSLAPLHERIDLAVAEGNVAPVAEQASEAELVRRIYLDLTGRIPTVGEARAFLQDGDPQKQARLVDRLLGGREFARHLAVTIDLWLIERRAEPHVPTALWRQYLTDSIASNKPLDQLAREILGADGTEEKSRAASRFYLSRLGEPHLVTRDVGRLFFGKDLQCAQCHDHPNVDDYLQRDYYELFAFYTRSALFHPDTKKPALLSEKADGEASFESVFTDAKGLAHPRPPGGEEIEDPARKAGEEYKVKPNPKDKKVRPIPNYSRREQLAVVATDGSNRAFNRNLANRFWAHMMGHGLVEPFDLDHAGNPAAHPELLDLLAEEIVAMKFDVRAFLRELALTQTYARSFEMPATLDEQASAVVARMAEWEEEASRRREASREASAEFSSAKKAWEEATKALDEQAGKLTEARKKREQAAAAKKKVEEPLVKARETLAAQEAKGKPLAEAAAKASEAAQVFPDDQELSGAAAKFRERSEALQAEIANLRAELAAKQKADDEAGAILDAATTTLDELQKLVDEESAKVAALEAELERAHVRYQAVEPGARHAKRRVEDARELIAYAEIVQEVRVAAGNAGGLGAELAELDHAAASKQELATDLEEAARHSAAAKASLPEDAELATAVEVLQERSSGARQQFEAADKELQEHKVRADAATAAAKEARGRLDSSLDSLTKRWTSAFAVGVFAPLTPEQLCASTLRATGEWDRILAAVVAEFEKKVAEAAQAEAAPETEEKAKEGEKKPEPPKLTEADRSRYLEEQMDARFKAAFDKFIKLFGGASGQAQSDFYATADQALFFENDGLVRGWLRPNGENLTARLMKIEDPAELADELYFSTVTRAPSDEEVLEVRNYLEAREKEKALAIQELAWALLSSVEFRFKH